MRCYRHHVKVNTNQVLGISISQATGNKRPPITPLRAKALQAEYLSHQALKQCGDLFDVEPSLVGDVRKTVARQGRCHDRKGIARIAPVARWVSERADDVHEFINRSGPAMAQEQGHGRGSHPKLMDVV